MLSPSRLYNWMCQGFLCIALILLAGCVTQTRGGFSENADPDKALAYSVQLARSYIRDGRWEAAKRHLKKALELDERSADVHEALGLVFQNTGEFERAEMHFTQALELGGETQSRVRMNYAAFLYQMQNYAKAAQLLEQVVEDSLYMKRADAYVSLARCYIKLERLQDAEAAYKRAYLMNRANVALMLEMAEVYFLLQDYPSAQQYYNQFRQNVRQQPARALWLGIQLARKFNDQNALSSYALALKSLYPTSKEYLEYRNSVEHDN